MKSATCRLPLQAKLLRVIQEREVVRVGSRQAIAINVRLITATNVKLDEAVAAGRFREDLYYRLNVASIHLPPLRERPGDILPLAQHFLKLYGARLGYAIVELAPETVHALLSYQWPGNIRELENTDSPCATGLPGHVIRPEDLRLSTSRSRWQRTERESAPSSLHDLEQVLTHLFNKPEPDLFHQIERTVVHTAFEYCDRNQLRTARLLGVSRNVVRDRLVRYALLNTHKEES